MNFREATYASLRRVMALRTSPVLRIFSRNTNGIAYPRYTFTLTRGAESRSAHRFASRPSACVRKRRRERSEMLRHRPFSDRLPLLQGGDFPPICDLRSRLSDENEKDEETRSRTGVSSSRIEKRERDKRLADVNIFPAVVIDADRCVGFYY